jgi:hypothetical protein
MSDSFDASRGTAPARVALAAAVWLMLGSASAGQGVQTGTIHGTVTDQQNLTMPGVAVTVTSPALLGDREAVSNGVGRYTLSALPAGEYHIRFELAGFTPVTRAVTVPLGLAVEQDASLRAGGFIETTRVVAAAPAPITTSVVGANFTHAEIDALATPRSLQGIAQLSPAVNENSPSINQVVINGAFAFDNIFMINGVDINDNLRAQPQNLFVEDAIQETQVLTSGISAEYGRFTGGVINAVTKSGGNTFSGSYRLNLVNPAWTVRTPIETSNRLDKVSGIHEATLGGPIVQNRVWFFGAGRYENSDASNTLPVTLTRYTQTTSNKRGEIKVTGAPVPNHVLQGGYLNNSTTTTNGSGALSFLVDPQSLDVVSLPNSSSFMNYRGVRGSHLLLQAQYSQREWMTGGGGTSTNIVDSPFFAATLGPYVFNAPYFDASDQEMRNNRQLTGSATSYWDKAGSHELKTGYEWFRSQRGGGGSQSPTSYVFSSDFALDAADRPLLDATGRLVPTFVPGVSGVDFIPATRGAVLNVDTNSFYVQDHWVINNRWSADLGMRYEHVKAESTGGIVGVNNHRIVPRLAVVHDVLGNGRHLIHATYGVYSGRYNEQQIGKNSPVVSAPDLFMVYQGPAGQGRDFTPGFDLANYPIAPGNAFVAVPPSSSVFMARALKSPIVQEFTTSYGTGGTRGSAEATYVFRRTSGMIEDFQTASTGTTSVVLEGIDAGVTTNTLLANSDLARRQYQGLVFQSQYRIRNGWRVDGHYTVQLQNDGNYEGETNGVPGATSKIGNYPEAFDAARFFPEGRLQSFQRHRFRMWSTYTFGLGGFGDVGLSGLWRLDSARVYSLTSTLPLTATQTGIIRGAGYPDAPPPGAVYFGPRGSETFKGYGLFDTSLNYTVPVLRTLRPWVKLDVYNVFNNQKQIGWNTSVRPDPNSPQDALGLPTGYLPGPLFGKATSPSHFPVPFNGSTGGRTFRVALGFRF